MFQHKIHLSQKSVVLQLFHVTFSLPTTCFAYPSISSPKETRMMSDDEDTQKQSTIA